MTTADASGGRRLGLSGRLRRDIGTRGHGYCIVGGASMSPLLHAGDVVRVERRDRVRCGDVVAFDLKGVATLHRVAALTAGGVVCRGDNSWCADAEVALSDVYGVATTLLPNKRLRGGRGALALARARFFVLAAPLVARAALDELDLLLRQAAGAQLPDSYADAAGPRDDSEVGRVLLDADCVTALLEGVASDEAAGSVSAAASPWVPELLIEVPAGVYSLLDKEQRARLLKRLVGHHVVVWGGHARGRRVRLLGASRRVVRRLGRDAGESGDSALRGEGRGWRRVHLFEVSELAFELAAAGGRESRAELVTTLGGSSYVRATAQL